MPTARISEETHKKLKYLSEMCDEKIIEIIEEAVERYRREKMMDRVNEEYRKLRENKELWEIELKERREWDVTLMDGIEDDDYTIDD